MKTATLGCNVTKRFYPGQNIEEVNDAFGGLSVVCGYNTEDICLHPAGEEGKLKCCIHNCPWFGKEKLDK